jgi:4-aminobutyrate aminotransferase/(S)-3-amino-2-methylpropionate transaminase
VSIERCWGGALRGAAPGVPGRGRGRCRDAGALLIADEIWTGLGRAGAALRSVADGVVPDLVCLGKGLGGGLPVSACLGHGDLMDAWSRDAEVVHTATFTGAPLPAAAALSTLDVLERERLDERAVALGDRLRAALAAALPGRPVRGRGLMIGVELGGGPGAAVAVARRLLERGYLTSTGGGAREVLVLTPPLTIDEALLEAFVPALVAATEEGAG